MPQKARLQGTLLIAKTERYVRTSVKIILSPKSDEISAKYN